MRTVAVNRSLPDWLDYAPVFLAVLSSSARTVCAQRCSGVQVCSLPPKTEIPKETCRCKCECKDEDAVRQEKNQDLTRARARQMNGVTMMTLLA